ncbi:hypothetical protein GP486_006453, partial [Trichoglossum hirsutum]
MTPQKVEDNNESLALMKTEFQDILQDPETLYKEILELIIKSRDLRIFSKNYHEQLHEIQQAIRRHKAVLDHVMAQEGSPHGSPLALKSAHRITKLLDPPLFDGNSKDGTMYNNWLIQVKNKLQDNADAYPIEELWIIYAAGCLYKYFDELYGDSNKEKNAHYAFKELAMKKGQTFQEFYA